MLVTNGAVGGGAVVVVDVVDVCLTDDVADEVVASELSVGWLASPRHPATTRTVLTPTTAKHRDPRRAASFAAGR